MRSGVIYDIRYMDELASMSSSIHKIHPLVKLFVTFGYMWTIVSIEKYNITGMFPMLLYLIVVFIISEVPLKESAKKLRIVLPICCVVGLLNPFFDQAPIITVGSMTITGGMISGLTLILKGCCTVLASYLLIATTGIEKICYALRLLRIPNLLVTQILLTYRYITVLLSETNQIYQAYSLRAPKQKGIHYKVWGPLLGQLVFRSIDRANILYDSMVIRGYQGEFYYKNIIKLRAHDILYAICWLNYFYIVRYTVMLERIGNLIM